MSAKSFLSDLKDKARVLRNTLKNSRPAPSIEALNEPFDSSFDRELEFTGRKRSSSHISSSSRHKESKSLLRENVGGKEKPSLKNRPKKQKIDPKVFAHEDSKLAQLDTQAVKDVKLQPSFRQSRKDFKSMREEREGEESRRTLFLGNFPLAVKQQELKKLCGAFGQVCSIRFRNIFGSRDNMSKGVAARRKSFSDSVTHCCVYVVFSEAKAATEAAKHFNGLKLGNRHLNANLACDKHTCNARMSVFVSQLPRDSDEEEVRLSFRQFGEIVSVRLIRDSGSGECKGLGYVQFNSQEPLMLCLKAQQHFFRNKRIKVARCFKKEKMNKNKNQQGTFYTQDLSNSSRSAKSGSNFNGTDKKKAQYVKNKASGKSKEKTAMASKKNVKKHTSSLI